MRTRASSVRSAATENPAPQKRPLGRKGRKRVLAEVPANVGGNEEVQATNHSPEERNIAVQVGKGPLESEDVAVVVARDSPARETSDGGLSEQQHKQQQLQVLSEESNTAVMTGQEAVACDNVVGDERTVGERECCPLPGLARASELSTLPDRAAGADTTRKTRRATYFVLRRQQDKTRNHENQRAERRSARCLSMGAATASTKVPTVAASSSSPVRDIGRAVPSTCDVKETSEAAATAAAAAKPPNEDASGSLGSPAPEPAEPAEDGTAAGVSALRTGRVNTEDLGAAALTFFATQARATATTRRASIPCRRSEKHPAAIRRRPFSVGSSGVAVLDGCLETVSILPPVIACSEKAGAIESSGSCAAAGCSSDRPLPASEEPATPPGSERDTKTPVSIDRSIECGTPQQQEQEQQPSTTSEMHSTSAGRSPASRDGPPLSPEQEPSTPHSALLALVDYASSPSASGSPSSTARSPLDTSSLSLGQTSTPRATFCALTALADYGRTASKVRPSQQPALLVEEGCSTLFWDGASGSKPDETADEGVPKDEGEVEDEAPVTAERAVPSDECEEAVEAAAAEEMADLRSGISLSLEGGVGVCDEKPQVVDEAQAITVEPVTTAPVPIDDGEVQPPGGEPIDLVSAESNYMSAIAAVEDAAEAAEGTPAPDAAEGAGVANQLGPAVSTEGVAHNPDPLDVTEPDATEMVPGEPVLGASTWAPSPGVDVDEAVVDPTVPPGEASTEASHARPASPGAVPGAEVEVAPQSKQVSEAGHVRPLRRSGRRRSIAALTTPAFDAALEREEMSTGGDGFCDAQDALPLETALPAPRRSGRRRSMAPRMPPLAAQAQAPADTAAPVVTAPEPLLATGAGSSDQENLFLLPEDQERNQAALAAAPSPVAVAVTSESSSSSAGAELWPGEADLPLQTARPPRRSGRRRSIAPKMQTLAAAPAAAAAPPTPAPAYTAVAGVTTPEALSSSGAGSSDQDNLLLQENQEGNQASLAAASSSLVAATATADAATSKPSSLFAGVDICSGDDILPLETARPPRRSGRRRSTAPSMPRLAAAPSPAPSTTDPPAAAAPPAPLLSAAEDSSGQDNLLPQEDREAHPPARSGRRRSVAVLRRNRMDGGEAEGPVTRPPVAAAPASPVGESTATTAAAAAATAAPSVSASATDAASSEETGKDKDEGSIIAAETGAVQQQQQQQQQDKAKLAGQQWQQEEEPSTRRRSRRRKSMRGVGAGGALGEDYDASQQAEPPVVQAFDGGEGGSGRATAGEGLTDVVTEGVREEEGAQTTGGGVVDGGQGQTAVLADLLNKCMETVRAEVPSDDALLPFLESLSAALADAEACVLGNDELRAAVDAGEHGRGVAAGQRRVRLCAFDFSTVGMPLDTTVGSGRQAEEVVRCLERAIGAQEDLHEALRGCSSGGGGGGGEDGGGGGLAAWRALLRELRAAAAAAAASREAGVGASSCAGTAPEGREGGGGGGGGAHVGYLDVLARERETSNAARVLLAELEPLEKREGPICSALRNRLASMLSSLIRFTLRIRLDAPPEKLTRAPEVLPPCGHPSAEEERRRAEASPPSHFSKVHKVVDVSDTDSSLGAAFSKALLRLEGFSGEVAAHIFAAAEAFEGYDQTTTGTSRLCEKGGCHERVEGARQLVLATGDVVDAVRARKFVLSLLEFEGVHEAIVEAGGWGSVESWASALKKLEGSADIDAPLTLLSDVEALKGWLRSDASWEHAANNAEQVLRRLLDLRPLKEVAERARQRWMCPEAYQLLRQDVLEAQERFKFPEVKKTVVAPAEADAGAKVEEKEEPAVEKTKTSGKGKQGRKKASSASTSAAPNKNKKSGSKAGGGKRGTTSSASSSSSSSSSDTTPRNDGASSSATTEKAGTTDNGNGATKAKSKRKRRSSIA